MRIAVSDLYRELRGNIDMYLLTEESANRLNDEMKKLSSWELMLLIQYIIDRRVDDQVSDIMKLVLLPKRDVLTFISNLNLQYGFKEPLFKQIEDSDFGKYINFIFENVGTPEEYEAWRFSKNSIKDDIIEESIENIQYCLYAVIFNLATKNKFDGCEREHLDMLVAHLELPNFTTWRRNLVINDIV